MDIKLLLTVLACAVLIYAVIKYQHKVKALFHPWVTNPFDSDRRGIAAYPTKQGSGWALDIPTVAPALAKYVLMMDPPKLKGGTALRMRFKVEGSDFLTVDPEGAIATIGLFMQHKDDKNWDNPAKRWYSTKVEVLAPGEIEIVAPLTPEGWGDMNGQHDPQAFAATVDNIGKIGVTLGTSFARGHGIWAGSPARLTLLEAPAVVSH